MKARFNPMIEQLATALFRVDQYADIFEKVALMRHLRAPLQCIFRRSMAQDIAKSSLLFIHVPKNGGTSIKRTLYDTDPGHATLRYYEMFFPKHLAQAETLAVLRDPVARFLSSYDFLMRGGGKDVRIQARPLRKMRHIRSIDDYLDFLETAKGDWLKVDTFARPQHWYITDIAGNVRVQHLWLLDEAGHGFAEFLRERGYPPMLHVNRTQREERVLSTAQRRRVERLYAKDFHLCAAIKRQGGYANRSAAFAPTPASKAETLLSIAS